MMTMYTNKNLNFLNNIFAKLKAAEQDNSGYSLSKATILKVFDATKTYTTEDILARLTLIDSMYSTQMSRRYYVVMLHSAFQRSMYSTQMSRRYYGLEELAKVLAEINQNKPLEKAFIDFLKDKSYDPFVIKGKKTNLFSEKYGIGKNGEDKGQAVSLISKYAYFETEFRFPIYDSIVREMYPRIWNYCGFKEKMLEIKANDMVSFIEAIDLLIRQLDCTDVTYDTLDRVLWYVGKIYRGNLSLVLSREEYDAFAEKFTTLNDKGKKELTFDIAEVDLKSLPIKKDSLVYDFFVLAKELKRLDNKPWDNAHSPQVAGIID